MGWLSDCRDWVSSKASSVSSFVSSSVQAWREKPVSRSLRSVYFLIDISTLVLTEIGVFKMLADETFCDVHARATDGEESTSHQFNAYANAASLVAMSICTTAYVVPRLKVIWEKSDVSKWSCGHRPPLNDETTPLIAAEEGRADAATTGVALSKGRKALLYAAWGFYGVNFCVSRIKNIVGSGNAIRVFLPVPEDDVQEWSWGIAAIMGMSSLLFNVSSFNKGIQKTVRGDLSRYIRNPLTSVVAVTSGVQAVDWANRYFMQYNIPAPYLWVIKSFAALSAASTSVFTQGESTREVFNNLRRAKSNHTFMFSVYMVYLAIWVPINTYQIKHAITDLAYPNAPVVPPNSTSIADTCVAISADTAGHSAEQLGFYGAAFPFASIYALVFVGYLLSKLFDNDAPLHRSVRVNDLSVLTYGAIACDQAQMQNNTRGHLTTDKQGSESANLNDSLDVFPSNESDISSDQLDEREHAALTALINEVGSRALLDEMLSICANPDAQVYLYDVTRPSSVPLFTRHRMQAEQQAEIRPKRHFSQ